LQPQALPQLVITAFLFSGFGIKAMAWVNARKTFNRFRRLAEKAAAMTPVL
jgi:hypothetical protein